MSIINQLIASNEKMRRMSAPALLSEALEHNPKLTPEQFREALINLGSSRDTTADIRDITKGTQPSQNITSHLAAINTSKHEVEQAAKSSSVIDKISEFTGMNLSNKKLVEVKPDGEVVEGKAPIKFDEILKQQPDKEAVEKMVGKGQKAIIDGQQKSESPDLFPRGKI